MVGFRFPSLSVSLCLQRAIVAVTAALAMLAVLPQAWGVTPTFTVAHTTFGPTAVGSVSTQFVTLTVNTAVPITKISIAPSFTEYVLGSIGGAGCTIDATGNTVVAAGTVCTLSVTFAPTRPGSATAPAPISRSAPLLVNDVENGKPNGYSFALTGSATGPVFAFAPGYLTAFVGNAGLVGGATPGCAAQTDANGDGCPATDALIYPSSMALDPAGNLYISDGPLEVVHKVDAVTGIISIYAGQYKQQGPSGSGGPATSAKFFNPDAIAVDQAGNVFVDDPVSGLWEINPATGIATIIAGGGPHGFAPGNTAATSTLPDMAALVVDSAGNIYFSAFSLGSVYRIDAVTNIISIVVGDGTPKFPATGIPGTAASAKLDEPWGLAMDSKGNLYIADEDNSLVLKVDTAGNISVAVGIQATSGQFEVGCSDDTGDWGPATAAFVGSPVALAFDTADNLYIGEPGSQGGESCPVRRVDAATGVIHVVAGDITDSYGFLNNVGATETYLSPNLVAVDGDGDIYVGQQNISSGVSKILSGQSALIFPQQSQDVTGLQLVTASNVGIGTDLTLSNYPFPIVPVPTTATPTPFSNQPLTGDDPQDCSVGTLPPGGICGIQVAFNPTSNASVVANETVEDDSLGVAGTTNVINIKGSAYNGPTITLAPNPLAFGSQAVGSPSAAKSTNFSIIISPTVTLDTITISGADASSFSLSTGSNDCTVGLSFPLGSGDCNIYVIFTPQAGGALSATLNTTFTAKGVTFDLSEPISGTGAQAAPTATLLPNPLAFGGQVISTTSPAQAVTLSNTGGAALTGIAPTITGTNSGSYAIGTGPAACGATLAAASNCNFWLTFSPNAAGSLPATLSVADNASPSPQTVSLTGTAVVFSSNVGTAEAPQPVTVYIATGGTTSAINVLTQGAANQDFTMMPGGTCATGTTYTAGQSCSVNIGFDPLFPGARDGAVELLDGEGNVLSTTYLPGTGFGPQIAYEPSVQSKLPNFSGGAYSAPLGVTTDAASNVFIADTLNARIIKIPQTGAGFGTPVNLPAIGLNQPSAVAVDGIGNLFIADTKNFRIVELPWNGSIYGTQVTLDASGLPDPDGIAVDGNGDVYVADGLDQKLVEIPWTGTGYGAPVTIAQASGLHSPHGVALDSSGDVFIADSDNNRVVEVPWTPTGFGAEVVLATELFYPEAVAVDGGGNLYIANTDPGTVLELPWNGSSFGNLTALPFANLANSNGLAVDPNGNVYVADATNSDILELNVSNPPTLNFAATNVGSTSSDSPKRVTVYNIGNVDLYFNAQDNNPVYPLDFPENSNDGNLCEEDNSVDQGSSCDVFVNFTPTVSGPLSEDVVLTDNNFNANATQSIVVKGNGIGASPTATLTGISFGSVTENTTSAAMTATLTNTSTSVAMTITGITITGTYGDDFNKATGTNACGTSLAANTSCMIYATFKPSIVGGETAKLNVADNATGSPQTSTLSGTGATAGAPIATLTPALAFPATAYGQGNQLLATLSNTGTATLTNISATVSGANGYMFKILTNGSCYGVTTLAAGASCTISVNFFPPEAGNFEAVLSVTDNAAGSPQTSTLTGEGTEPDLQFSPGQFNLLAGTPGMAGDTGSGPDNAALIGGGYGIALDSTGLLYFSDRTYNVVWQIDDNGDIDLIAGTPATTGGYGGDGGGASGAMLKGPEQIAFDPAGNLYIADTSNNLIRVVDSAGNINTFAGHYGNGFGGYAGDGGPANQATLSSPQGVTSDPLGNIYISDTNNFVIRKVDTTGKITLFAGTPNSSGYSGDNGPATSAKLGQVYQLATDANGNLYMADFGSSVVRKVDSSGTITTYAGGGAAAVTTTPQAATNVSLAPGPVGLATDPAGNLYIIANLGVGGNHIYVVNTSQQISSIVGGGSTIVNGVPSNAEEINANAVALDQFGDIFISDAANHIVSEVGPFGDLVFPSTPVNSTSAPLTVTLSNTGNAPLVFSNQDDEGVVPARSRKAHSADGSSAKRDRGNVVDFNSYGNIEGPFAIASGGTCNFDNGIDAGTSCTMNVTFTPTATGGASGLIHLYTQVGNQSNYYNAVLLSGTGTAVSNPIAKLSPALAFPNTNTGTTSAALFATLSNTGGAALDISSIAIGGTSPADFAIGTGSNACGTTLAADAACYIYVTFTPALAAGFSATLTVTDNASPTTQSVTLSGTGTTPPAPIASLKPSSLSFTALSGTTSAAQSATLSNTGNATLNITSIAIGGTNSSDFAITTGSNACGETLAADASCTIYVTFSAASVGSFSAALNVTDNASGSPQSTTLTGTGTAPPDFAISATPATQTIQPGASTSYTVTVKSTGGDFAGSVALAASGLPTGATAAFSPTSVSPGSGSGNSTLTIQTAGGQLARSRTSIWPLATPALALLLMIPMRRWRKAWKGKLMLVVVGLVSLASALTLMGCGGGFALLQPSQTYTITITGSSGADTHSTTVQLTVQ